jgi:hypothetical protein
MFFFIQGYDKPRDFQNASAWGWLNFLTKWELTNPNSKLFTTSGDMKLRVRFTQYENSDEYISGKVDDLNCVKRKAAEEALNDFSRLARRCDMADLEIETSDGQIFKAHKVFLAGQFNAYTSIWDLYFPIQLLRNLFFNRNKVRSIRQVRHKESRIYIIRVKFTKYYFMINSIKGFTDV